MIPKAKIVHPRLYTKTYIHKSQSNFNSEGGNDKYTTSMVICHIRTFASGPTHGVVGF